MYVQSFPARGTKYQISTNGGFQPHWRKDGKELFYLSAAREIMAVDIGASKDGTFKAGIPQKLFQASVSVTGVRNSWDVTSVLNLLGGATDQKPTITIVTNWLAHPAQSR